ncbi:MAG: LysM peptidoglycan-binding domain-containing protein [Alphaproteobacteria bacterium]|nr:LysM peptidoglycan-binding domain-containing protein [Alphaproteobacteria bacterium]MCY4499591.1 Ig-like domain-containing protein [Rhodospirillaceae bacterium]
MVRVNPEGNAVIAGQASPKSEVTVYAGEDVVGTVKADDRGDWVLVPEAPLESGAQTLSLRALDEEGEPTKSEHVVVVMIPDREGPAAGDTSHVTAGELRQVIAVAIPRQTFGASRLLQGPTVSPDVLSGDTVQLSAVSYDERGRLVLAGVASPGSDVRVKIDGRGIGSTVADDTGYWELIPAKAVAIGDHTLSVASVDEAGRIITSTEMPFMRADVVEASLRPGELRFIVQPGNSLWRIARAAYGQGILYTVIYSANVEKIEDPDLIYPGQIFSLPPQH